MDIRIEKQNIRYKISERELQMLLSGENIVQRTECNTGDMVFGITIITGEKGIKFSWEVSEKVVTGILYVSPDMLTILNEKGRSREGVEDKDGELALALMVDIHQDARRVKIRNSI